MTHGELHGIEAGSMFESGVQAINLEDYHWLFHGNIMEYDGYMAFKPVSRSILDG